MNLGAMAPPIASLSRRRERGILAAVALGTMLAPLNSTMIAVALAEIAATFGVGAGDVAWLVVSYLIAMAVVQPVAGGVGDLVGRRGIFLGSLAVFTLVSIAATLSPSLPTLIVLRILQALAGAMAIPNGTALVRECIPHERRGSAFGTISGLTGLAAALGPPLGGLIVALGGWRAIFWANLPIVALAIVLAWVTFPRDERKLRGNAGVSTYRFLLSTFNFVGAALLAVVLAALALIPTSLRNGNALLAVAQAIGVIVLGALFVRNERRVARPVISLSLFRSSAFAAASTTVALGNLAMYTTLLTIPQFLHGIQHRDSWEVGLILAALSVPMAMLAPIGGRLADHFGRRAPAIVGSGLLVAGLAPFLGLRAEWSVWLLAALLALAGTGLAIQGPAVQAAAVEAAPAEHAGMASGVYSTSRYLGSIVGSAALAALLGSSAPTTGALFAVFTMVALAAVGALISAWLLRTG